MICQTRRSFSDLESEEPSIRCLYSADGQLKDLRTDLSILTLHFFGICQSVWLTGRKEKEQRRRGQRGHGYLSTSAGNNNDFKLPYRKRQKLDSIMCTEYPKQRPKTTQPTPFGYLCPILKLLEFRNRLLSSSRTRPCQLHRDRRGDVINPDLWRWR